MADHAAGGSDHRDLAGHWHAAGVVAVTNPHPPETGDRGSDGPAPCAATDSAGVLPVDLFSPTSPIGGFWVQVTGTTLTFSFVGLVLASVLYSLPFMVQPLQGAFEALGRAPLEAAASLRASPLDRFFTVVTPMTARGFLTAIVLTFAHTIGEFGVVLMVGGNIPGQTKVVSIQIYEQVETINYDAAHVLAAILLVFSFTVLLSVYAVNRRFPIHVGQG
jgi:molybdate transport system permease protein